MKHNFASLDIKLNQHNKDLIEIYTRVHDLHDGLLFTKNFSVHTHTARQKKSIQA
jgi:hypothetical protein